MSWDAYVTNLTANAHVKDAAIFGFEGGKWASSAGLNEVQAAQVKAMLKAFGEPSALYQSGITLCSTRYIFLRVSDDGNQLFFKKSATGGVIARTGQALVIATYGEGMQPGACNTAVGKIADYLRSSGY